MGLQIMDRNYNMFDDICSLTDTTVIIAVEVTVKGPVERATGMVMNIQELKEYMVSFFNKNYNFF